ncbi:serine hydrolase domain-containing protein [Nonomuraea longicatena]|uniref:Serine hydrolase n=1 Tax=Nonomuraea longicatena TaxID=83682 RepID=A0ABN1QCQ4_9ACTN
MLLERKPAIRRALAAWSAGVAVLLGSAAPASADTSLTRFVDDHVTAQLKRHEIPGAAVVVVTNDKQTFAKGYGVADLATGRAVDAEQTVFAPASVAKLMTATAVMQLVDKGQLSLDTDVNDYLRDFRIDDTYPGKPVTTAHLLTHTAGFAGGDRGTGAASPKDIGELGAYLADRRPARVRPPGVTAVYSNFGMGLAGHLVELRSGLPFHEYMRKNVFEPLGMSSTTFAQPEPDAISGALAVGYRLAGDRQIPAAGARYGHMPPHGAGFRTTATDMAKFMQAHLNDGGAILSPESARLMQSRRFGNAEGANGLGYGFQEYTRNGTRLILHRGNIPGYFAMLALIPERGVGIYAHYNGSGKGGADSVWALVDAFADRYAAPRQDAPPTGELPDPSGFAGTYRSLQGADAEDFSRITTLMRTTTVTAQSDGTLTTAGTSGHGPVEPRQWTQVSPGLFQEKGGHRRIMFREDGVLATENPSDPLQKVAWYQLPALHLGTLAASLGILVLSTLVWPVALAVRSARRRPAHAGTARAPRLAGLPGWAAAALVTASAATLVVLFADFDGNQAAYFLGGSPLLTLIGTMPLLAAVATAGAAVTTVLAWRRKWWSRFGRVHLTVVTVAATAYLVVASAYNLLG